MLPKAASGRTRSFGDVGPMSGLPKSGHDWTIYEHTPELDAASPISGAQPGRLHCTACPPPGIAAADDDAETGAL